MPTVDLVDLLLAAHDAAKPEFLRACPGPALVELPREALGWPCWPALADAHALRVHLLSPEPAASARLQAACPRLVSQRGGRWVVEGEPALVLDEQPLAPGERRPLRDGQRLVLGEQACVFLEPGSLFDVLGEVMRAGRETPVACPQAA